MSTEPTPDAVESDAEAGARAADLAADLGDAIADMSAYERFEETKAAVEADEAVQERIREFERLREEFVLARQTGDATNEDLRKLQEAQQELHEIPVMAEFLRARSELELELQELNGTISAPLAVDFGETAGGCCQD